MLKIKPSQKKSTEKYDDRRADRIKMNTLNLNK